MQSNRTNFVKILTPKFGIEDYQKKINITFPDLAKLIEKDDEIHFITGILAEGARQAIATGNINTLRRIMLFVDEILTNNKLEQIDSEIINSLYISFITLEELMQFEYKEIILNEISDQFKKILEKAI